MVSTPWSTPDPRRAALAAPSFAAPYALPVDAGPSPKQDVLAGALAAIGTVLLGAPLGLLWAAVAPRTDVVINGQDVQLLEPGSTAFIAADGAFLLLAALVGALTGVLAWRLGRASGPAVVVGLTVGGLTAAYVAMIVGEQVGRAELEAAVRSAQEGAIELTLRLRAQEALVGWPVGAMVGYLGAAFLRGR